MVARPAHCTSLVYPIQEGYVLLLDGEYTIYNRRLKKTASHICYIWIQRLLKGRKKVRHTHRPVLMFKVYIPTIPGQRKQRICIHGRVQRDSLRKKLKVHGFTIVATDVTFHYNRKCWRAFWRRIDDMEFCQL